MALVINTCCDCVPWDVVSQTETSPAESPHAVGEKISFAGAYYTVTSAIARGDSIVEGVNIKKGTIGQEISELQSLFVRAVVALPYPALGAFSVARNAVVDWQITGYHPIALIGEHANTTPGVVIGNFFFIENTPNRVAYSVVNTNDEAVPEGSINAYILFARIGMVPLVS